MLTQGGRWREAIHRDMDCHVASGSSQRLRPQLLLFSHRQYPIYDE